MRRNLKKGSSIALITLMYVFALVVGIFVFKGLEPSMHELWAVFLADVVAAVLIWGCGVVCLSSATIQLIADTQIHRFRAAHPGEPCTAGLWKHGRHPNYFGEVQFWWGIWLMYASLNGLDWLVLSPIAMTALFLFISIPMMEKRQLARKPAYAAYRKNTRILI